MAELSTLSARALSDDLSHPAELVVSAVEGTAVLLGAFQRSGDALAAGPTSVDTRPVFRRGSGGAAASVGPGSLHLLLRLRAPDALVPCDPPRLLNRYVRPLLKGLGRTGALAHYFGRDWVSVAGRPVALLAAAHDARTQRCAVEVVVAVSTPFTTGARASFLGKVPATLHEVGKPTALENVAAAVRRSYADAFGGQEISSWAEPEPAISLVDEPPWAARVPDVIGDVCAGRDAAGRMRLGGELLASADAVAALEGSLTRLSPDVSRTELAELVADAFGPGTLLEGARAESLVSALAQAFTRET